jgi:D-alanine-D-alanine ligase
VVKTPDGGSSVGVYIVRRKEDLEPAVRGCLDYGRSFMIEQFIEGREFTCGVLCGQALPSVEIVPRTRFYDYSNKYVAGATEEICPGRVTPEIEKEIGRIALQVHDIMGLQTYSRCDFMLDDQDQVWFIEVNTLPGMTQTSLVPQEAAKVGISYEDLCEKIVEDGLKIRGKSAWKS